MLLKRPVNIVHTGHNVERMVSMCKEVEPVTTCCLCGRVFRGYGNNPWPLSHDIDDRCCDGCNDSKVIPARLSHMKGKSHNGS